jgi:CheY-like chemotaxis protein
MHSLDGKKEAVVNSPINSFINYRPCLLLAHSDTAFAACASRTYRRFGWDVYCAQSGPEVRRLARMLSPDLIVLEGELPGESGWLTCDKLTREHPHIKVMLVVDAANAESHDFATFVGAAGLIDRSESVMGLVEEVCKGAMPAAC